MICPKCKGTGKIPKPLNMREMGEADCEVCEGTGVLLDDNTEIVKRLDRIIKLLEGK